MTDTPYADGEPEDLDDERSIARRHRFGDELVPLQKLDWFAMAGVVALVVSGMAVMGALAWAAVRATALLWELV